MGYGMITTLLVILYLIVGFVQSSLMHKYYYPIDSGFVFVIFTLIWPILTVAVSLALLGDGLIGYMDWLRKDKS